MGCHIAPCTHAQRTAHNEGHEGSNTTKAQGQQKQSCLDYADPSLRVIKKQHHESTRNKQPKEKCWPDYRDPSRRTGLVSKDIVVFFGPACPRFVWSSGRFAISSAGWLQ